MDFNIINSPYTLHAILEIVRILMQESLKLIQESQNQVVIPNNVNENSGVADPRSCKTRNFQGLQIHEHKVVPLHTV